MTQFEEITQSPETLAAFLSSLPVIDGPWDKEFQAQFCAGCIEKYAVIATYHNGARTGGIVEAESGAVAWEKALAMFNPRITAALEVSRILTPKQEEE